MDAMYERGKMDEATTGIPAALFAAQAGWESNYGQSVRAQELLDLFGLTGADVKFLSLEENISYYEKLLSDSTGKYAYLHGMDLAGWVNNIGSKYASNPDYSQCLWAMINMWDLK